MEVDSLDAVLALMFVVITIAVVVRGIRRGDPSRKIRMYAFFPAFGIATGVRGFFPNNLRVSAVYISVLLVMAAAAVWKGPRSLGR
jgi:formate hydrogenlyase subunit 3/multisubunit Na+/H+ antiporter MnhD subunit